MRSIRAVIVLIGIVLSAVGLLSYDASASNDDGLSKLAACVGERKHLLVLGLVDESGSLRATDPEARRVDGLLTALSTLADTSSRADSAKIEILLAGFSTSYVPSGDWLPLNRNTLPILRERAESFRTRNVGNDTDFYEALSHAQESLGRKASEVGTGTSAPCRALLLFTDGGYEFGQHGPNDRVRYAPNLRLDGRDNWEQVVELGRNLICKPDGLVDQLRAAQTSIVTIALTKQNNSSNLAFLESIGLQSAADGTACGRRTDWLGEYIPVDDVGNLLNAFLKAVYTATGGTYTNLKPCPFNAAPCQMNFEIDKSLRAFSLHINLGAPGVVAEIKSPRRAAPLRLQADESATPTFGSAMLHVFPDLPLNLVVDAELPAETDDWVGIWSVTFVDQTGQNPGAMPSLQITMFGGLAPVVDPLPVFQVEKRSEFEIRVIDRMGSPQTPANFGGSATVTATVTDPVSGAAQSLDVQGGAAGRYRSGYTVPAVTTASSLNLTVTLDVVTKGGVHLQPSQRTYQVPVQLPPSFPTIDPPQLRLSTIVDHGASTGGLEIIGAKRWRGCVWFSGMEGRSALDVAGHITFTFDPPAANAESCIRVSPGERRTVLVTASPEYIRNGVAEGLISAHATSDIEPGTLLVVAIPYSFELIKSLNTLVIWLVLVLLLAGLLLPLIVVWLINKFFSTFGGKVS